LLFLIYIDARIALIGDNLELLGLKLIFMSIKYTLLPAAVYVVFLLAKINADSTVKLLWGSPLILNAVITTSVFYSDAFLYIDTNGIIQFGRLSVLPYCVAFSYSCALIAVIVFQLIRYNRRATECCNVFVIGLIPVLSTILEIQYGIKGAILTGFSVSTAFLYVYIIINQKDLDTLTKVMNRRRFYLDAKENAADVTAVMLLDLNGLKKINDTYGHDQGDKAILTMISVVRSVIPYGVNLYRAGGDEFTMLCFNKTEKEVSHLVDLIIIAMESVEFSWAVGYSMVTPNCNIDEALKMADRRMYAEKRDMKKSQNSASADVLGIV